MDKLTLYFDLSIKELSDNLNVTLTYDQTFDLVKQLIAFDPDYEFNLQLLEYLIKYFIKVIEEDINTGESIEDFDDFFEVVDKLSEFRDKMTIEP